MVLVMIFYTAIIGVAAGYFVVKMDSRNRLEVNELVREVVRLANKPPTMVPTNEKVDTPGLVTSIANAVSKMQFGPENLQTRDDHIDIATLMAQASNPESPPGEYFPDVEFDEWVNTNGMPKGPGWMPPPTFRTEMTTNPTGEYPSSGHQSTNSPGTNGTTGMFRSGASGPSPVNKTE